MSLRTDRKFVGPCTIGVSKLGQEEVPKDLHKLLKQHKLVAANTWSVRKPATHVQGNSRSQIDFVLLRQNQAQGPGKSCSPCRQFQVASWRDGSRHFPLLGRILHSRRYSAQPGKVYDQLAMLQAGLREDSTLHGSSRRRVGRSGAILDGTSLSYGKSDAS